MTGKEAAQLIRNERRFLGNVLRDFCPQDEGFCPVDGMMTVAQQIRHIAHVIDWIREGGFGAGFDMDFERMQAENRKPCTLAEALQALDRAYDTFIALLEQTSTETLLEPLPPNEILGPRPRLAVIGACNDHTAHHRGVLTVYLRLLGRTPAMVYAE